MKNYAIGVDIGGSHVSCAAIDIVNGTIISGSETERGVNNQASSEEILKEWSLAILQSAEHVGIENLKGVGFAMPGPFLYDKGIAKFTAAVAKFQNLYDINVVESLNDLLNFQEKLPMRFMNDASAFAVGEAWLGKSSNSNKSVSITLGTGFGSAFVTDGIPVVEGEGVPPMGCVWHLPFKDGIGDDYFSTRWFEKEWFKLSGEKLAGVKSVADKAYTNSDAQSLFTKFGDHLGEFMGPWLKDFRADILVMGGNVSGAYQLFGPAFEAKLKAIGLNANIEISNLKEQASLIGSARMLDDDYFEKILPVLSKM